MFNMEKRVIMVFLAMLLLFSVSVIGQGNSSGSANIVDPIDKAYQCLDKQIEDKEGISLSEAIFGTYALGSKTKLLEKIDGEKKSNEECWPRGGCKIKDTAQAMLAYKLVGKDVSKIKDWLLSKTHGTKDLIWYLEMDIKDHIPSSCSLYYDGEYKLKINDLMKIEGNPGPCFEVSFGGYWLKLKDSCIDKEFEISCENNFVTTLVYQKQSGGTIYISSETHLGDQGARTKEKVSSMCFGIGSACDYEGSLWASMALKYNDEDVSAHVPYLLALSSDNLKLFPAAFLYYIVGGQDKYSEIIQNQKLGKYWDIVGSPYNRFYDTSLAMLSLGGSDAPELDLTKKYLIESQTKEGCWNNNNIKDTAFILFSGWQRDYSPVVKNNSDENDTRELCKPLGYFCAAAGDCLASGGAIYDYACSTFREVCCSVDVVEPTCIDKKGLICGANQDCDGNTEHSSDGSCCVGGACIDRKAENVCEDISNGECKSECLEDEEEKDDSCPISGDVCCVEKEEPTDNPSKEKSSSLWLIILLIVLILLVILGIVYRHKIQMWWYSRQKGRGNVGSGGPGRSQGGIGGMPPGMMPRPMPRYGPPGQRPPIRGGPAPRITRGAKTPQDRELEETMRKLKEMSE